MRGGVASLRRSTQFHRVINKGERASTPSLTLMVAPPAARGGGGADLPVRLGVQTTKKDCSRMAVRRAEVRRRTRHAAAHVLAGRARGGLEFVLEPRLCVLLTPWSDLVAETESAAQALGCLRDGAAEVRPPPYPASAGRGTVPMAELFARGVLPPGEANSWAYALYGAAAQGGVLRAALADLERTTELAFLHDWYRDMLAPSAEVHRRTAMLREDALRSYGRGAPVCSPVATAFKLMARENSCHLLPDVVPRVRELVEAAAVCRSLRV